MPFERPIPLFDYVEAFMLSSGISEFNVFSRSLSGQLSLEAVCGIDPNPAITAATAQGALSKQFLSGRTFRAGVLRTGSSHGPAAVRVVLQ
jgi:hypothetical protein